MYVHHLRQYYQTEGTSRLEAACPAATHRVLRSRSVREFDLAAACPVHSHADVDEFYVTQHCADVLEAVDIPMLLLNARDDPVIDQSLAELGLAAARSNPNLISVVTKRGGHLGWVETLDAHGTPNCLNKL